MEPSLNVTAKCYWYCRTSLHLLEITGSYHTTCYIYGCTIHLARVYGKTFRTYKWTDGLTDRQTNERRTCKWKDWRTDRQTDILIEIRRCMTLHLESKHFSISKQLFVLCVLTFEPQGLCDMYVTCTLPIVQVTWDPRRMMIHSSLAHSASDIWSLENDDSLIIGP